jgi:hypothetical protein
MEPEKSISPLFEKDRKRLEAAVVYWQTLFEESQNELSTLRSKIWELEVQIEASYISPDDRPQYLEESHFAHDHQSRRRDTWFLPGLLSRLMPQMNP